MLFVFFLSIGKNMDHYSIIYGTVQLQLHTRVIFCVVSRVFAIVVHAKLKPWFATTSGLNPCVV